MRKRRRLDGPRRWLQPSTVDRDGWCLTLRWDDARYAERPFNFMHRLYLTGLGVAREDGAELVLDAVGLAAYQPPENATDELLLIAEGAPSARVSISPTNTRIDPIAARWLWDKRTEHESETWVLTSSAWCIHCGGYFEDTRARNGSGHRVARWCPACRTKRSRKLPQERQCAAEDCEHWFKPSRQNQQFCTDRCKSAQQRKDADGRRAA